MIRSGDFDRLLLRPRNTLLQVAAMEWELRKFGSILQALIVFVWAFAKLPGLHSVGGVIAVTWMTAGGVAIFYGLLILQATLAFWTVESLEMVNSVTYGGTETASYPMNIYAPWFRGFFTFLIPLACINFLPLAYWLVRPEYLIHPVWLSQILPVVGFVFLALAMRLWRFGERRYTSTGS